jgi:hypothetical protein
LGIRNSRAAQVKNADRLTQKMRRVLGASGAVLP